MARGDLQARLGHILDRLLAEPAAWDLGPDGRYRRIEPTVGQRHIHDLMIDDAGLNRTGD